MPPLILFLLPGLNLRQSLPPLNGPFIYKIINRLITRWGKSLHDPNTHEHCFTGYQALDTWAFERHSCLWERRLPVNWLGSVCTRLDPSVWSHFVFFVPGFRPKEQLLPETYSLWLRQRFEMCDRNHSAFTFLLRTEALLFYFCVY
jgi:hypothetical protein